MTTDDKILNGSLHGSLNGPHVGPLTGHERFEELAAMIPLSVLSAEEREELAAHLRICLECRESARQYQILSEEGAGVLGANYPWTEFAGPWDNTGVHSKLSARVQAEASQPIFDRATEQTLAAAEGKQRGSWMWLLRGAAAAVVIVAVGFGGYRFREFKDASVRQRVTSEVASVEDRAEKLAQEKGTLANLVKTQDQQLVKLQQDSLQKQQDADALRAQVTEWQGHSNDFAAAKQKSDQQAQEISQQRDALAVRLREAENSYQNVRTELTNLRAERDRTALRLTSLEMQVNELAATNREDEGKLKNQQDFLSYDRDVRELMGARNLYIADVFDVDSASRKRAPFGRVFYTRGKSLVFYAFDLDHEGADVKKAVFQAWGEKDLPEGRKEQPVNLGILYLDSQENRRWALRCDDPKQLAQIEAVFVTVEPTGGSQKPSSKAFLYALLRKEVNHP